MSRVNSDSLAKRLRAMSRLAVDAKILYRLYRDLGDAFTTDDRVAREALFFWSSAYNSLHDAVMLRMIRLYDPHASGLSLPRLLKDIQQSRHLFTKGPFLERLKGRPFAKRLARRDRRPRAQGVREDLVLVSRLDPLVSKLVKMRDTVYAHLDPRNVDNPMRLSQQGLSVTELQELIDRALTLTNHYCDLYLAERTSPRSVGQDDYRTVLNAVAALIQAAEREIEDELGRDGGSV